MENTLELVESDPQTEHRLLAHHVNNSLGVILGRCEMLSELAEGRSDLANHVHWIQQAARRIQGLIEKYE